MRIPTLDDAALRAAFDACTMVRPDWTHRAHVRIAWLYLRDRRSFDAALPLLRVGIRRLNESFGNRNTEDEGYHETITAGMLRLIDATMRRHGAGADSDAFCDEQPQLMTHKILRLYYTKDHICSRQARATFVEPDLAPFPR